MKKNLVLLVVFLIDCLSVFSQQEIRVISCKLNTTDISVRTNKRDDPTGKPCALVKVQFPKRGAQFLGDIIGSVAFKTNEYWVYMPQSSNQLEIRLEGFKPFVVKFNELETGILESNQSTYELCLLAKEKDAPQMYDDGMVALAHKDIIKAFDCLTKAANAGYAPALYVMGDESVVSFDRNYDSDPNDGDAYQEAYRYYKEGAEKGSSDAQNALAKMLMDYKEGKEFEKKYGDPWTSNITKIEVDGKWLDDKYIWTLLEKAANAGNTDAQWYMITKFDWCSQAANNGIAIAEFGMGVWNDTFEGMNSAAYFHSWENNLSLLKGAVEAVEDRTKDARISTEWYAKAANKGLDIAMWTLADKYQEGVGIEKSIDKAISLREKVADNGNIFCQLYMAQSFRDGVMPEYFDDGGPGSPMVEITEDISVVDYWMKRVINHTESDLIQLERYAGCSMDMTLYDISYRCTEKELKKESVYWLQRAAEWGSEDAKEKLGQLGLSVPKSLKLNEE